MEFEITKWPEDEYWQKLETALEKGVGPDLYQMDLYHMESFSSYGAELPAHFFSIEVLQQAYMHVDSVVLNHRIYHIPIGIKTGGIYYNRTLWNQSGLSEEDIPETWDDFFLVAKRLSMIEGEGIQSPQVMDPIRASSRLFLAMIIQKGISLYETSTGKINIVNPDTRSVLSYLYHSLKAFSSLKTMDMEPDRQFAEGDLAMIPHDNGFDRFLKDTSPELDWGFFPYPSFDGEYSHGYDYADLVLTPGVSVTSDLMKKNVVFDFINFLISEKQQKQIAIHDCACYPTQKSLQMERHYQDDIVLEKLTEVIDKTTPLNMMSEHVRDNFLKGGMSELFRNEKTILGILEDVQQILNDQNMNEGD